jgi:hypothetical protein
MGNFKVIANTFQSTVATGTAPFAVASTTKVSNLNADSLDGHDSIYFQTALTDGSIPADYLQATGADLGDADVSIDLSNTHSGRATNITTDGVASLKPPDQDSCD